VVEYHSVYHNSCTSRKSITRVVPHGIEIHRAQLQLRTLTRLMLTLSSALPRLSLATSATRGVSTGDKWTQLASNLARGGKDIFLREEEFHHSSIPACDTVPCTCCARADDTQCTVVGLLCGQWPCTKQYSSSTKSECQREGGRGRQV